MKTLIAWRMKYLIVTHVLSFYSLAILNDATAADCIPIGRTHESQHDLIWPKVSTITHKGHYCLTEDVESKSIFDLASGGRAYSRVPMWAVEAGPSKIDLRHHKLSTDQPYDLISIRTAGISILNGKLDAEGGYGIRFVGSKNNRFTSLRSDYIGWQDKYLRDSTYQEEIGAVSGEIHRLFLVADLKIDRVELKIGSPNVALPTAGPVLSAVAIQGSGNSITNNVITVRNGHVGIYLFGAGQHIEGNTIVFKCPGTTPSAAPIKLHAADNSIIRNNTIVIDCWSDKPQAAISLVDSRNVVIENNRIIGVKQLYKVWDERPEQRSNVIERGNSFPTLWERILGK